MESFLKSLRKSNTPEKSPKLKEKLNNSLRISSNHITKSSIIAFLKNKSRKSQSLSLI